MPSIALLIRGSPSKLKGFVTIATVSAPLSLLSRAATGAAPVPVPPPIPAAMKTISDLSNTSLISVMLSSAEVLPMSGSAPAPRPMVMAGPNWIL